MVYVLRDLPGIDWAEKTAVRWHADKNRLWSKEFDGMEERMAATSKRLFGIDPDGAEDLDPTETETDAEFWERCSAYRAHFDVYYESSDNEEAVGNFLALGWDVRGADGQILQCLPWFATPIICAAKGLKGRLPDAPMSDQEALEAAEAWGARLLQDAAPRQRSHLRHG